MSEGWYIPQTTHRHIYQRWVLGVIGGGVCYSRGGTRHYFCQSDTFERWQKRWKAQLKGKPKITANKSTEQ